MDDSKSRRKKEVMNKILDELDMYKKSYPMEFWESFLKNGHIGPTRPSLQHLHHQILRKIIKENPPHSKKLFELRREICFTITNQGKPVQEAALERFIIVSNPEDFSNQIPIGGSRECIDIGIRENDKKFLFVELKPWTATDSPLYALLELLKNLIEYRIIYEDKIIEYSIIHENKLAVIPYTDKIDLMVLAPIEYYQKYWLIDQNRNRMEKNIKVLGERLKDLGNEFHTSISFWCLQISKKELYDKCRQIYEARRNNIEEKVCLSEEEKDCFPELQQSSWIPLVNEGKI